MGVNHGGTSPPEFGVGTLMQIAPPPDSCFKILNTRLLALQCSKKLINPIILTEYSLFPKSTSSTSTKSPLQAEIRHFCGKDTDKKYRSECIKHAISSEKFFFFSGERA